MPKRGRPPHPDILTPREWQVLELLRLDLSNERIAERLSISLDGAKYHVSEILSKLGVSSREEAATWQPPVEKAPWRRAVALPLVAKAAGLAFTAAAIGGLIVLAIGVAKTQDSSSIETLSLQSLSPGDNPDRDVALLNARVRGEIADVSASASGAAWTISVTTWSTGPPRPAPNFGPPGSRSAEPACWRSTTTTSTGGGSPFAPVLSNSVEKLQDSECHYEGVFRESALIIAGRQEYRSSDGETSPPLVASSTLGAVSSALAEAGFPVETANNASDNSVWLVMYTAPLLLGEGSIPEGGTPRPTTLLVCSQVATVVDAATGEVLLNTIQPASTRG